LLLYTDGAVEAIDASEDFYGSERLQDRLVAHRQDGPDAALAAILADVRAWGGASGFEDDVTLLSVDATGETTGDATGE